MDGTGINAGHANASSQESTLKTHQLIISNKPYPTRGSFPVSSPASGKPIHHFGNATVEDGCHAAEVAHSAFPVWRSMPQYQKRDIFLRTADLMQSRREVLRKVMIDEIGASTDWADFNINLMIDMLKDIAGRITSLVGTVPSTNDEATSAIVYKEPFGVVLSIAPWNAPYILGSRSIVYPLAAGNTVVIKATEMSPLCIHNIVTCFHDAGLPEGVLNLVACQSPDAATVTKAVIEHRAIKKINFTGSTLVGKAIAKVAAENLKPALLELGGKSPAIICDDADLELAAMECTVGSFLASGQICMSTERIIVNEKVIDEFESKFKEAIGKFAPAENGPRYLISRDAVDKNENLLADAISKGATILHGSPGKGDEAKMDPVVIKGVREGMDLYHTESFGPTVSLIVVKDDNEAVRKANDTEYGLTSSVFSADLRRAMRIAKQIETGAVHINGMTVHDQPGLPHGGVKSSGYGRFGSCGLEEWVRTKTVTFPN